MTRQLFALLIGLAAAWTAGPAHAGGIIVVLRSSATGEISTNAVGTDQEAESETGPSHPLDGKSSGDGTGRHGLPPMKVSPVNPPFEPVVDRQLFAMGDEELDYADVGCGGAQAASGPLGALPLAVAGLALLLRRRR